MLSKKDLLSKIKAKGYSFKVYDHEPLFTVKDSIKNRGTIKGSHSKNLFLKTM